jgi:hypothetical protein
VVKPDASIPSDRLKWSGDFLAWNFGDSGLRVLPDLQVLFAIQSVDWYSTATSIFERGISLLGVAGSPLLLIMTRLEASAAGNAEAFFFRTFVC